MSAYGVLSDNEDSDSNRRSRWAQRAAAALEARQLRNSVFGDVLFGEPGWDMLLALYVAENRGATTTASGLIEFLGVPSTTGWRWLHVLDANLLISRRTGPTDKTVHIVELTDRGRHTLDQFFAEAPVV